MKKLYKNKRDMYKADAEFWRDQAQSKQKRLDELNKPKVVKQTNVKWLCPICRVVNTGSIDFNQSIENCRCPECGHLGLLAVSKINSF